MAGARRILVVGYFGFGNLGDDAILDATLAGLRAGCSPPPLVTLTAGEPVSAEARFGVAAVHWQDVDAIAEAVRTVDLVVIGGGGLLQDWWGVDPDLLLTPEHWGMALYVGPAILAAAVGTPVALHALGVGPLASQDARRLAKAACDASVSVVVRDGSSRELLASCGVDRGRIAVAADPAFLLPVERGTGAAEWRRLLGGHAGPLVAAALRPWQVGVEASAWEGEVSRGLDLVVEEHDAAVVLVPFQSVHHEWPAGYRSDTDLDVARRVRGGMRHAGRAVIAGGDHSPAEVAGLLGGCDAVLAMRLHALVLAALGGSPAATLAYDPKVASCAEALGLGAHTLSAVSATGEQVARAVGGILEDRDRSAREVAARLGPLRSAASRGIERLARLVEDPPPAPGSLSPELAAHLDRLIAAQMSRASRARGDRAELDAHRERAGAARAELAAAHSALEAEKLRARDAEQRAEREKASADAAAAEASRLAARVAELEGLSTDLEQRLALLELESSKLRAAARELERWQGSRLWRLASVYWGLLDRLPGRRTRR